jgi:alpha-D-ribose 1-methylphosphonate 5-triphosphate synthase subunit PhnH
MSAASAHKLSPGFRDPILESQATFRILMTAMAEPGLVQRLPALETPLPGLPPAAVSLLLTLVDYDTPLWLPAFAGRDEAAMFLRFHTGVPIAADPRTCRFVLRDGETSAPRLSELDLGSDTYPDQSATVIVICTSIDGGQPVRLSGPGIERARSIEPAGLHAEFWRDVQENHARYPLGVDLFLVAGDQVLGVPRSTAVEVL